MKLTMCDEADNVRTWNYSSAFVFVHVSCGVAIIIIVLLCCIKSLPGSYIKTYTDNAERENSTKHLFPLCQ